MPLPPVRGHADVRATLIRALRAGTLPQSILLHGPEGIGKERLGLWLAQLLVCGSPSDSGPCGACTSCRAALKLEHPDIHWFFPLERPDGAAADRLREKLEDARASELELRRADPLRVPTYEKAPAHFLAAVQTILRLASMRPSVGSHKAFVVGEAEAMVPQESSPEAANAFLKLLEEPPPVTTLIVTAQRPGALLPTIRSRLLPIRLLPLSISEVAGFLEEEVGLPAAEAARVAALSQGSIGRALRLLPDGDSPGPLDSRRRAARDLLLAALSDSAVGRLAAAHDASPSGARADLPVLLDAFATWLRDVLALASGAGDRAINLDAPEELVERIRARPPHPLGVGRALDRVDAAKEMAYGNVNPQLILADLLRGVQADLRSRE